MARDKPRFRARRRDGNREDPPPHVQSLTDRLATVADRPRPLQPVRIALVITDLDVGGAERAMVNLARGLDPRRWSVRVIALGPEGELAARLREHGIACECLGARRH